MSESYDPLSPSASTSACLLNIATGKSASASTTTKDYGITSLETGNELHMKFREEYAEDRSRLLKPIKRKGVQHFTAGNTKPKKTGTSKYTAVVINQRDSFI